MGPNTKKVDRKGKGGSLPDSPPPVFMIARENLGEKADNSSSMGNHPRKNSSEQSGSSPSEPVEGTTGMQNLRSSIAGMHIHDAAPVPMESVQDESIQSTKRKERSWSPSPASVEAAHEDDERVPTEALKRRRVHPVGTRNDTKPGATAGRAFLVIFIIGKPCTY